MSNVVPLPRRSPAQSRPTPAANDRLVADLAALMDEIGVMGSRALETCGGSEEAERVVQHLLDAVSALERATDLLDADDAREP